MRHHNDSCNAAGQSKQWKLTIKFRRRGQAIHLPRLSSSTAQQGLTEGVIIKPALLLLARRATHFPWLLHRTSWLAFLSLEPDSRHSARIVAGAGVQFGHLAIRAVVSCGYYDVTLCHWQRSAHEGGKQPSQPPKLLQA